MQPGALRALEFDRIVEAVRGLALTPMGSERLLWAHAALLERDAKLAAIEAHFRPKVLSTCIDIIDTYG